MIKKTLLIAGLLVLLPGIAAAQTKNSENTLKLDDGASSPSAQIEDVAWLAGYWRGEGLGGESEEMWGQPIGDRMLGVFSLSRHGRLVFSEAMSLVEEEGSLVLKIKHFSPDFTGWEEKNDFVSFPLVRLGEQEAYFSGLTFRRQGERLEAFVVLESGGMTREVALRFERVKL